MKDKLIIFKFLLIILPVTYCYSQSTNYALYFKNIEKGVFCLPSDHNVCFKTLKYAPIRHVEFQYSSNNNTIIDSCIIEDDTMSVYFNPKGMVVILDSSTLNFAYEITGKCNYKRSFILSLPLCSPKPFNGETIMIQSFDKQFFFKKAKKKYIFSGYKYINMNLDYFIRNNMQIKYGSIRS